MKLLFTFVHFGDHGMFFLPGRCMREMLAFPRNTLIFDPSLIKCFFSSVCMQCSPERRVVRAVFGTHLCAAPKR